MPNDKVRSSGSSQRYSQEYGLVKTTTIDPKVFSIDEMQEGFLEAVQQYNAEQYVKERQASHPNGATLTYTFFNNNRLFKTDIEAKFGADGKVSEETAERISRQLADKYAKTDTNNDGVITINEMVGQSFTPMDFQDFKSDAIDKVLERNQPSLSKGELLGRIREVEEVFNRSAADGLLSKAEYQKIKDLMTRNGVVMDDELQVDSVAHPSGTPMKREFRQMTPE